MDCSEEVAVFEEDISWILAGYLLIYILFPKHSHNTQHLMSSGSATGGDPCRRFGLSGGDGPLASPL